MEVSRSSDVLTMADVAELLKRKKWWFVGVLALASAVAFLFVAVVTPKYVAKAFVASNQDPIRGGQFQQLAGLLELGGASGNTSLAEFTVVIRSRTTAAGLSKDTDVLQRLFPERWDEETRSWLPSPGVTARLRRLVYEDLLGIQLPSPGPDMLVEHVRENVEIDYSGATPSLLEIRYDNRDPNLALYFLEALINEAESTLLDRYREINATRLEYAQRQLEQAHLIDVREALNSIIVSELRRAVTLSSGDLESMRIVLSPEVSLIPKRPSLLVSLLLFNTVAFLGLLIALIIAGRLR